LTFGVVFAIEIALVDMVKELGVEPVIVAEDVVSPSAGVDEDVGIKVGQSHSDSPRESRRGLSLASIKQRLSLDGLGA
jgi:ABC-type Fe3+-citrate transport system substrate-binding protein